MRRIDVYPGHCATIAQLCGIVTRRHTDISKVARLCHNIESFESFGIVIREAFAGARTPLMAYSDRHSQQCWAKRGNKLKIM